MDANEITVLIQRMRSHGLRLDVEHTRLVATTAAAESVMPAFLEVVNAHAEAVLRNLRPPLATDRRAAAPVIRQDPQAWAAAGRAIERARKPAVPITHAGAAHPTRRPQTGAEGPKKREGSR